MLTELNSDRSMCRMGTPKGSHGGPEISVTLGLPDVSLKRFGDE
jgi:hypothetical protein